MAETYVQRIKRILGNNLIRLFYSNETTGSIAYDHSDFAGNGAIVGADLGQASQLNGMNTFCFDGVDDSVNFGAPLSSDWSDAQKQTGSVFGFKLVPDWFDNTTEVLVSLRNDQGQIFELVKSAANDRLAAAYVIGGAYTKAEIAGLDALVGNNMFFFCVTWNANAPSITLMINESEQENTNNAGTVSSAWSTGSYGERQSAGGLEFTGCTGIIGYVNSVLTDTQKEQLKNI